MAFVLADWVWETTTTTGTGAVTLAGAVTGYRAFSSQLSNGDTCYYSMWDGTDYEEGLGTYTSAGNTLTRTTVYRSTNAGAAVNWGAGTRQIVCAPLGVTQQSLYTPGSTGIPNRTADNTWAYAATTGTGSVVLSSSPTVTNLKLAAGSTTLAPIVMSSGASLTTATAGAVEYDGTVFYATNTGSTRGVSPSSQYAILNNSTYTLTSTTAAQKLFNSSTNGAVTLPVGIHEFECMVTFSAASATSGSVSFGITAGTATLTSTWTGMAGRLATGNAGTNNFSMNTGSTVSAVTANSTQTTGGFFIRGVIRVTVSGTVIPQMAMSVAAPIVIGANSYFRTSQIGSTSVATVGNWS